MGTKQRERVRRQLMRRRRELLKRRDEGLLLEQVLSQSEIGDEVDTSVKDQERNLVERLKEFEYNELRSVQRALQRIEEDEYDVCASCGHPIQARRLLANPEATLCVSCAARRRGPTRPGRVEAWLQG